MSQSKHIVSRHAAAVVIEEALAANKAFQTNAFTPWINDPVTNERRDLTPTEYRRGFRLHLKQEAKREAIRKMAQVAVAAKRAPVLVDERPVVEQVADVLLAVLSDAEQAKPNSL